MSLRRSFLLIGAEVVPPPGRQNAMYTTAIRYRSSLLSSYQSHSRAARNPTFLPRRFFHGSTSHDSPTNDTLPLHAVEEQEEEKEEDDDDRTSKNVSFARRVWRQQQQQQRDKTTMDTVVVEHWTMRIDQRINLPDLIHSIQAQERTGGRMREVQLGVLHSDPGIELRHLVDNYTVTAIASALRDREDALQYAATLSAEGRMDELSYFLQQYHPRYILERRSEKYNHTKMMDPVLHLNLESARQVLRKSLMRMPRTISTSFSKRAGVCLALAWLADTAVIVLEKRAENLRTHPDEVCLPGGMVCDIRDETIVSTSIREMKEEIYGLEDCPVEVLGILRLNWGEVHHLTGVAVTPVVCYLGDLPESLAPGSPEEVSEVFTIPLKDLVDNENWIHKEGLAPIFVGGPHVIWGLTGYILERFRKDILRPLRLKNENNNNNNNLDVP